MIEVLPLGAHVVLHNAASAAMVLASPETAELGLGPRATLGASWPLSEPDLAQIASRIGAETVSVWQAAGLFEAGPYPPDDPLPFVSEGAHRMVFSGPGGVVALDLPDTRLADQLATLLGFCHRSEDGPSRVYRFVGDGTFYTAYEGACPLTEAIDLDGARYLAARLVCEAVSDAAASFHAAAVAHQGRALMLVGESGRGKTTTALGLLAAGCTQLADDHVALDALGRVCAFPGAIGLKAGTVPLPEAQALLRDGREAAPVRGGVRYVIAPNRAATGAPHPVAGLVFPEFTADFPVDAPAEMTRIGPEEALLGVIGAGARVARGFGSAAPLVAFVNDVPCWRMVYATSDQSVSACRALLA